MTNTWKNIALWTTLTASALTGNLFAETPKQDNQPSTRQAQVSTDSGLEEKLTIANRELRDFPIKIPGAGKVEKYETQGAKYCLVHIQQMHFSPSTSRSEIEKIKDPKEKETVSKKIVRLYNKADRVQKNIFDTYNHLIENEGLEEVFAEGISRDITPKTLRIFYALKSSSAICTGLFDEEWKKDKDTLKYLAGAELLLGAREKLKLLPATNSELNKKAREAKDPKEYNEPREDFVLSQVEKYDKPLSVLVYGKDHDFKDNIKRWNKKYSDKKFSLIEITPSEYSRENDTKISSQSK